MSNNFIPLFGCNMEQNVGQETAEKKTVRSLMTDRSEYLYMACSGDAVSAGCNVVALFDADEKKLFPFSNILASSAPGIYITVSLERENASPGPSFFLPILPCWL
jgi:hypothetical protein